MARLDDLAQDYVAMGISDEDNIWPCGQCGASILPWYLRCEGCGGNGKAKKPVMFLCQWDEEHENEYEAELYGKVDNEED